MSSAHMVCVIDDDEPVRDSVAFLLEAEGWTTCKYASAEAFVKDRPADCACIVTDVRMPGMDGLALLRHLRSVGATSPVVVMTGHGDVPLAVAAMKDGASDFLQKPFSDDSLIAAVRTAIEGGKANLSADPDSQARVAELSAREREVLEGLVNGKANKVIAHDLGISPRTVEIYRANVMSKMQADSFADLVRLALRAGITLE